MDRSRWLILIAVAGIAIVALSFLDGWITHDREVRGEGSRFIQITLNAWRSVAMPVLTAGVLAALGTAVGAAIALRWSSIKRAWLLPAGAVLALALIGASMVPIEQDGHASSVDLSAGWLAAIGIGLAGLMLVGAARATGPSRRLVVALGVVGAVAFAGGIGGRWLGLQWREGTGQHWSEGSYVRAATAGERAETLTIDQGRFRIGERWAGTWESSGGTIVLVDDAACPDARGTYHAHDEGPSGVDLRFVKVVDTCGDGARAAALEAGIWVRQP
ncbi:MAG: hypothetical protein ACRDG7_08425 [Candidatus Limnocylindria bacterium]